MESQDHRAVARLAVTLFRDTHDCVVVADPLRSEIREANPAMLSISGYTAAELVGRRWQELFGTPDPERLDRLRRALREGVRFRDEGGLFLRTRSGDRVPVALTAVIDAAGDEAPTAVLLARPASRRQGVERDLRRRFRDLFDASPDAIFVEDHEGFVIDANPAAGALHGMSPAELIGKNVSELVPPFARDDVMDEFARIVQGDTSCAEGYSWTADGREVPVEIRASRIEYGGRPAVLLHVRDITNRRRAEHERRSIEAKMQQTQKLESLGVLAGGIAHDFNNLLVGVLGAADQALLDLGCDRAVRRSLEQVRLASRRAAELCRQLLAYSGKGAFVVESIDLSRVVAEMIDLLEVTSSGRVDVQTCLETGLPPVRADVTQLRQVVMNLVTNAVEAVPEELAGAVRVSTGAREFTGEELAAHGVGAPLEPGAYVYLEVADDGCGIASEAMDHIFDPFFTTKRTGRGLGLAAILGIVRSHHGALHVKSRADRGTVMTVLLPRAPEPAPHRPATRATSRNWRGRGSVLVVDDESLVRDVARVVLESRGFTVVTADGGRAALELVRARGGGFDIVLLDHSMTDVDGHATLVELRRIDPRVPVVVTSGYPEDEVVRRFDGLGAVGFLQKPFMVEDLVNAMRRGLRGRMAGTERA